MNKYKIIKPQEINHFDKPAPSMIKRNGLTEKIGLFTNPFLATYGIVASKSGNKTAMIMARKIRMLQYDRKSLVVLCPHRESSRGLINAGVRIHYNQAEMQYGITQSAHYFLCKKRKNKTHIVDW